MEVVLVFINFHLVYPGFFSSHFDVVTHILKSFEHILQLFFHSHHVVLEFLIVHPVTLIDALGIMSNKPVVFTKPIQDHGEVALELVLRQGNDVDEMKLLCDCRHMEILIENNDSKGKDKEHWDYPYYSLKNHKCRLENFSSFIDLLLLRFGGLAIFSSLNISLISWMLLLIFLSEIMENLGFVPLSSKFFFILSSSLKLLSLNMVSSERLRRYLFTFLL